MQTHRFVKPVLDAPGITIGQMVDTGPLPTTAALPETVERPRPMTAVERAQARAAAVTTDAAGTMPAPAEEPVSTGGTTSADHAPDPARTHAVASGAPDEASSAGAGAEGRRRPVPRRPPAPACEAFHPQLGRCTRESEHPANHRNKEGETWK